MDKEIKRSTNASLFTQALARDVVNSRKYMVVALPPIVEDELDNTFKVGQFAGGCSGCGLPFKRSDLDVFSFPCGHIYHILCFGYMGEVFGKFLETGCMEVIPERATRMLGISHVPVKLEDKSNGKWLDTTLSIYVVQFHMYSWY